MNKKLIQKMKKKFRGLFYFIVKYEFLVNIITSFDFFNYLWCRLNNRPYFGIYLLSGQTWEERKPFMRKLMKQEILRKSDNGFQSLEIGSWTGNSAILWADTLKEFNGEGSIVCVDPWKPYVKTEKNMANVSPKVMQRALKKDKVYKLFHYNISAAGHSEVIVPIRGTSDQVLPLLGADMFDFIFIDGAHYYSNVMKDLQNTEHLIRPGGVICGDDLELQYDEVDVDFARANQEKSNFAFDPKTKKEFHPGVTMAIADFFNRQVTSHSGFWFMRKISDGWEPVVLDD